MFEMIIFNVDNCSADEYYYLSFNKKKSKFIVVKWFTLTILIDTANKRQDLNPYLSNSRVCIFSHLHILIHLILRLPLISFVSIIQMSSVLSR